MANYRMGENYIAGYNLGFNSVVKTAEIVQDWKDRGEARQVANSIKNDLATFDQDPNVQKAQQGLRALQDPAARQTMSAQDRAALVSQNAQISKQRMAIIQQHGMTNPTNKYIQDAVGGYLKTEATTWDMMTKEMDLLND